MTSNKPVNDTIAIARDVLALEIAGLSALRDGLNGDFALATEAIAKCRGRVIVSGMGKSGHIARKIAATLSSTGTPSIFVHPGEASHGDLGMIGRDDAIIALSKSGETAELGDLLAYAARFSIPVIAITAIRSSALAKIATASIILPDAEEACGETRAPTTSTTMMAAVGDALAVALLRLRGFTANDFQGFHPGGNLGAALRRARDIMHPAKNAPLVNSDTPMPDAVKTITESGFGCVGVTDSKGKLIGVITDGDLRRRFHQDLSRQNAADIMTKTPRTAAPDTLAGDVLALMSREKITALFIVEDDKPVGIVHVHDCLSLGVL